MADHARRIPEAAWLLAIPAALLAMWIACGKGHLGTAVVDDYSFLAHLMFQKPLDWFDSMGATYYWRPISRQLYFTLVGPWLLRAPWGAALLHTIILGGIGVLAFRIARRELRVEVAAAIAAGVVLAEPARVLLGWPSGAQHLLASAFALLAVHEAQARRIGTAALAALAGVLSHESAALALPLLPLLTWRDRRDWRATGIALGAAIAVAAAWRGGYAIALHHGVATPPMHSPQGDAGPMSVRVPLVVSRAIAASLNLEDVTGPERSFVLFGVAISIVIAAFLFTRPAGRARLLAILPAVVTGLAWFLLGIMPLTLLLPDWNAWRAWTPSIGFAFAVPALLGAASPWLAGAWAGLRLAGLLAAPGAPAIVSREPSATVSHMSYPRLTRLQSIVEATREALVVNVPRLEPHARVCYWELPRLAEFAYQGSRALQVWYGDSTLTWTAFGGQKGLTSKLAAGVEFRYTDPVVAAWVPEPSIRYYQRAAALSLSDSLDSADAWLERSIQALGHDNGPYLGTLYENMALNAYRRQQFARADSLNEYAYRIGVETGSYWMLHAVHDLMREDRDAAERSLRRSLDLDARNPTARAMLEEVMKLK